MNAYRHDRPQAKAPWRFSDAHDFDAEHMEEFDGPPELLAQLRNKCPVAHSNDLGGFWLFTKYDDVAAAIADPSLYSTAVQNVVPRVATAGRRPPLHLDPTEHTPYRGFARTPTQDITVRGRDICEYEPIALAFASANRDADVYENTFEFRLKRKGCRPHLAFGRGPHQCAGAPLARLMLTSSIEAFVAHCDGFELNGPIPMTTWPE